MSISYSEIFGMSTVILSNQLYEVTINPDYGCQIISIRNVKKNINILKMPCDCDSTEYLHAPQHFGNAILFPPNRIAGGCYTKNGITYDFFTPQERLHEGPGCMYSHGVLRFKKFSVDGVTETGNSVILTASYHSDRHDRIYGDILHDFICTITIEVNDSGVYQNISIRNMGDDILPVGTGFHTAFLLPNDDTSSRQDYRIIFSAGEHIELDSHTLPTGKFMPLKSSCRTDGILPFEHIEDEHTTNVPLIIDGKPFYGAIIKNTRTNNNIYFETSSNFGFWMLWNNRALSDYICIEPMSWMINAPNTDLPDEVTGYNQLLSGEAVTYSLHFYTD